MRRFTKLFNVTAEEGPQVLFLFLLFVLTQIGVIWGSTTAYTVFLDQVGIQALPWIMAIGALISVASTAVYTVFVDRVSNHKLLIYTYIFLAAGIVLGLILIRVGLSWAYPFIYLVFLAWGSVADSHLGTYLNGLYDIQAAKRTLPVIFGGTRVGMIVGGFTLLPLNNWFAPEIIIFAWLLVNAVIIGLLAAMPYILKSRKTHTDQPGYSSGVGESRSEKQAFSFAANLQEGFRYTLQSTYLRWIMVSILLMTLLMSLVEYRTSDLMLQTLGSRERMSSMIAMVLGISNAIVLPMLMFGLSRLIAWLGLGNASMIFPVGNLLACGGLVFAAPGLGLVSAIAAYVDRTALRSVFYFPIRGLFYNAVPIKVRGRARAFMGGLVDPLGSLIGNLVLVLPFVKASTWLIGVLIGLLAVGFLVVSYVVRREYSQALVKMLEEEDYTFLLSQEASELPMADPATLSRLQKKLEESDSHELTVFMTQLIAQIGGHQALSILGLAIKGVPVGRTRSAMVDVLVAAGRRDERARELYTDLLSDPDGQVRQSAIAGLEQITGSSNEPFYGRMLEMIEDPDLAVCTRALSVLVRSGKFYQFEQAVQVLDRLLSDEDPGRRASGVRVLGEIGQSRALQRLLDYLHDPTDQVRLQAAVAFEESLLKVFPDLKEPEQHMDALIVEKIGALVNDPIERVRQAALVVLGRVSSGESRALLIGALADHSSQIRETAIDELVRAGKAIIPLVHSKLDSADPQSRKMATVVLSRISPSEFGSLVISGSVTGNLLTIYRNYGLSEALSVCKEYRSIAILQSALNEQSRRLANEILYLLSAVRDPQAVKIIGGALSDEAPRVRANATEALEALTTPQMAKLIAPLFEPGGSVAKLLAVGHESWNLEQPDATQAIQQLVNARDEHWLRAMTVFSLGEIGTSLRDSNGHKGEDKTPDETAGREEPAHRRAGRGAAFADLLGALDDASAAPKEGERGPRGRRSASRDLLGALSDGAEAEKKDAGEVTAQSQETPKPCLALKFSLAEIEAILETAVNDPAEDVRSAAQVAKRKLAVSGKDFVGKEAGLLSTIDRIIFLKEVPFFKDMTIDQLRVLASVCEEKLYPAGTRIFNNGEPGGVLYVVVNGRVGIEQEKRTGSFARLADIDAYSYFGEMEFFDNRPRSTSAVAARDTLTLRLHRAPLIELARQYPDMSLELINVLSQRLREASDRIADLTSSRPRALHQFYDQFD